MAAYNASVVSFYNTALFAWETNLFNYTLNFEKCFRLLQRRRCKCKFKSRRIVSRGTDFSLVIFH
jgi:hypothetical protein